MTDWQEARGALVEEIALLSRGWESNPELRAMRQARDAIDALSVRLAQECALRAQAEQERDVAEGTAEVLSGHLASTAEKLHGAEARLREYEEALKKCWDCGQTSGEIRRIVEAALGDVKHG